MLKSLFSKGLLFLCSSFMVLPSIAAESTSLSHVDACKGPSWASEGVVYSIFPRTFSSSGTLQGVTEKLEDLEKLGVTILWFLPLHPTGQHMKKGTIGSPYAVQDYYAINPDYGTKEDFKRLVAKAHALGLRVIIDAVLNHTSWDHVLLKTPEFYVQDQNHRILPPVPDWSDVAALNYSNPELRAYILEMLKYWIKEFDLDGFRFDAAHMVPLDFWKQVRSELHQVKRDILLLAEEDEPRALVEAFDMDYAWPFEGALNDIIVNGASATATLKSALAYEKKAFPKGALHLRFSDNHDKKRAIVRFGEKGALAASALIFTLDGVPLLYNGMEVGDTSETHPPALFETIPIFWGANEIRPEFKQFYRAIIALRKKHVALRDGETIWLKNSEESRIVSYLRRMQEEEFIVVINFSNFSFEGTVDVDNHCKYSDILRPIKLPNSTIKTLPMLSLRPWEFCIFQCK